MQQRRESARREPCFRTLAVIVMTAVQVAAAPAQSLDSTLEDLIEDQINEQVESQLADSLAQTVEQQVDSNITDSIEQQIESGVADSIEQQIESGVADSVEQQIESGVIDSVEQHIESGIAEIVEGHVASDVSRAVEQELDGNPANAVGDELDPLVGTEPGAVAEGAGSGSSDEVQQGADGGDNDEGSDAETARVERFIAAVDENGRTVERDVWIILVPPQHVARIDGWGFDIQERRALTSLDRVLVRVTAPVDRQIAEAALELALDAPGTLVDFNHTYGSDAAETDLPEQETTRRAPGLGTSLAIGVIDTAVAVEHEALRAADIVQRDFVPYEAPRPTGHGTAVASIMVGEAPVLHGRLTGARLYAASVFFTDAAGNTVATTESLVDALEWLVAEQVPVINMSLSGPPNRVLEGAIEVVAESGPVVVAAVGNNGPAGEPLFPAAYEQVVGVTAVDSGNRVYRYANRGRQVTFAAPGVAVNVALAQGNYGAETGTSMAAPYAAAVIARMLTRESRSSSYVLSTLKATALDLGDKDFDDVYGFGLIADAQ